MNGHVNVIAQSIYRVLQTPHKARSLV